MNVRYSQTILLILLILLLAMLAGCDSNDANETIPDQPSTEEISSNMVQPTPLAEVSPPKSLTLERVKNEFQEDLTIEQAREIFGQPVETRDIYTLVNDNLEIVDQYIYESDNAKLITKRSKEGKLLYAIFHDSVASGERRSFLPNFAGIQESSSEDNRLAKEFKIHLDTTVKLYSTTNAYQLWSGIRSIKSNILETSTEYKVISLTADFAEVEDESGSGGWVPVWYLTPEVAQIKDISPLVLKAAEGATVLWYPNSKGVAITMKQGEELYAYKQYGDWYGVAVTDKEPDGKFGLLWIHKDQVASVVADAAWFNQSRSDGVNAQSVAAVVRGLLMPGVDQARVRVIFGEPSFKESSENVATLDEKARTLPLWRYEDDKNELIVAWTDTGTVRFALHRDTSKPWDGGKQGPVVPSQQVEWDWRFQSDLAYNFLLEKIGNVLLIAGEDGGFSGMHNNSNVYALNASNGRKLWQIDLGFDSHMYGLSEDKERIIFVKRSMENDRNVYTMSALKTSTGQKLWEKKLDNGQDISSFAVSQNVFSTVHYERISTTEDKYSYFLVGWSMKTGKQIWKIELNEPSDFTNRNDNQEVLLVQTEAGELQAYDPHTGKMFWKKPDYVTNLFYELNDGVRLGEYAKAIWAKKNGEIVLTDVKTGKDRLRLPYRLEDHIRYDIIDSKYVFMQKNALWSGTDEGEQVKSSLLDVQTGKEIFTQVGAADYGKIEGDIVYYRLNGKPMSYDMKNSVQRWTSAYIPGEGTNGASMVHFDDKRIAAFPGYGQIYVLDETTGEAKYRILDTRVGIYDITPSEFINGYLSVIDNKLYIGSSNGYFSKVK